MLLEEGNYQNTVVARCSSTAMHLHRPTIAYLILSTTVDKMGWFENAIRDDDESVTGDANRGNFLVMLKLTAKIQHTFHHEANIRPTSLTSLVEELSESHFYGKSMQA